MHFPKLAFPNLFLNPKTLKEFAIDHGFQGIDWTLRPEDLPKTHAERAHFIETIEKLRPLEVRYHCFFVNKDLGHPDPLRARAALKIFREATLLVSRVAGRFVTVHVGLGLDSTDGLSWDSTIIGLKRLVEFAAKLGVRVCLENLASGWTSEPEFFAALLGNAGCRGTLDIGHVRACSAVTGDECRMEDFTLPQPERFRNAHVYHEEKPIRGHVPPANLADIQDRLGLLRRLPLCDWWVLELRTEADLLRTLSVVREFLQSEATSQAV